MRAEWIEMRSDYNERISRGEKGSKVMLYVHGGAYYFGSVDEHRYQIQRHTRKLKARCLAPRYRLAPQFPFPCGLQDCLAAYLFLLDEYEPTRILLAGDSAGGGMVTSLLVVLRDRNIPLPAGAMLLSPWVDLMHSFPSVGGDGKLDYIPNNGFIHRPSVSWPPSTIEPGHSMPIVVAAAGNRPITSPKSEDKHAKHSEMKDEEQGFSVVPAENANARPTQLNESVPSIEIDGEVIQIRDQIQIYAPNHLLAHPLVSPVLQPSLGGLPPLLIQVGGGEMLRDEQIYLAHKAAHPSRYPPSNEILDQYDPDRIQIDGFKPTHVQLQVWEDLCHVGHTLSWTHPAKYMYRSVAQFGAWALSRAQKCDIDIMDEEDESDIESLSSNDEEVSPSPSNLSKQQSSKEQSISLPSFAPVKANRCIGKAGDPLPPFHDHMIRQRVDRHGKIFDLAPASELPALQLSPSEIGVLKDVPVRRWLRRQEEWNSKFARLKKQLQRQRARELEKGYVGIPRGEKPPPTALAGRRTQNMPRLEEIKRSWGMSLWSSWGSKHDQHTVERNPFEQVPSDGGASTGEVDGMAQQWSRKGIQRTRSRSVGANRNRPRSTSRTVRDEGQTESNNPNQQTYGRTLSPNAQSPRPERASTVGETIIPLTHTASTRPTHGGIAYPFKLQALDDSRKSVNPSIITLNSDGQEDEIDSDRADESANKKAQRDKGTPNEAGVDKDVRSEAVGKSAERPQVERFVTAPEV